MPLRTFVSLVLRTAYRALQLVIKNSSQIDCNRAVCVAFAGHGVQCAVQIDVPFQRGPLNGQVFADIAQMTCLWRAHFGSPFFASFPALANANSRWITAF